MAKKELKNLLLLLEALTEFKKTVLSFYEACSHVFKEDKAFWDSMIEEKKYRIQDIRRMAAIITERPQNFDMTNSFNYDISNMFIIYIKSVLKKIRNGKLTKREALIAGLNIELSAIGTKYNEIVRTSDLEYLNIAKGVTSNTIIHRSRLNKKINNMDKLSDGINPEIDLKVPLNGLSVNEGAEVNYADSVIGIIYLHNQFKDYLELFRNIFSEQSPVPSVWENIEKVIKFNKAEIYEHFVFEESYIFNKISEKFQSKEVAATLNEVIAEHARIKEMFERIENIFKKNNLPLAKEKEEALKSLINEFIDIVLEHLKKEEDKLLPLFNSDKV